MGRARKNPEEETTAQAEERQATELAAEQAEEAEPKAAPKAKPTAKTGGPKRVEEQRAAGRPAPLERARGQRKERRGVVVSNATDKTIVVRVDTAKPHPRYKKVVRRSQKIHAHDEANTANVGDVVRIVETRPLSRLKHWRLAEVVERAR